jgi:hypothetical protein
LHIPLASCSLWKSGVRIITNSGITFWRLHSLLIVSLFLRPLIPTKPFDIPIASCALSKSPVRLLTNIGIMAVKKIMVTLGRLHSLLTSSSLGHSHPQYATGYPRCLPQLVEISSSNSHQQWDNS